MHGLVGQDEADGSGVVVGGVWDSDHDLRPWHACHADAASNRLHLPISYQIISYHIIPYLTYHTVSYTLIDDNIWLGLAVLLETKVINYPTLQQPKAMDVHSFSHQDAD